jgi:hypothetical protein
MLKKLIKQYISCDHNYLTDRKVMALNKPIEPMPKWIERYKCDKCERITYSDYFIELGNKRIYEKDF